MTWDNAKKGYDFTVKNGTAIVKGTAEFCGKVDKKLDDMGVDKKEVAQKTGAALWDATKAVGSALWIGTQAAVSVVQDSQK